jgi:undecaprenyl-diphosphatase
MISQLVYNFNLLVFKIVDMLANPALNKFMIYFIDSFYVVLPLVAIYLYLKKDKNVYTFIFAAVALYIIVDIIKLIVREPRPCNVPSLSYINHLGCESTFSFPSEHAAVLSGLAIFLKRYKYLRWIYIAWVVLVLFGKVYLGQHYFTDIVAGVIIGVVLAEIMARFGDKINGFLGGIVKRVFRLLRIERLAI